MTSILELPATKACTKCGEVKSLETGFWILKTMNDGRASWCKTCATSMTKQIRDQHRINVIEALGGRCQCSWEECSISKAVHLTIDHIEGGGNQIRKTIKSANSYYKDMLTHLADFQLLCWNHNHEKRMLQGEHQGRVL